MGSSGIEQCKGCGTFYSKSLYSDCPNRCKVTTVSFQAYGHVTPSPYSMTEYYQKLVDQELLKIKQNSWIDKEECMCEKKEPTTRWNLRIGYDGPGKYTVEFKKRVADDSKGHTLSVDDLVRTFETFEDALKYTNETYKVLSK